MLPPLENLQLIPWEIGFTDCSILSREPCVNYAITESRMSEIHETAIIYPGVTIGNGTRIGPNCVIGGPPEHIKYWKDKYKSVVIGENCWIGSGVTVDSGTEQNTVIGSNCILLRHSHVGHDALLEDGVSLSPNSLIGGHTVVMVGASVGMGAIIRQKLIIGAYSMCGMGAVQTKDLPCGEIWIGNPAKFMKINEHSINKNKITPEQLAFERKRYGDYRLYST